MRSNFSSNEKSEVMSMLDPNAQTFLDILRSERRDLLNRMRDTRFSTLKEGYSQGQIIPFSSYSPWRDDGIFLRLFEKITGSTMVDIYRCYELYTLAKQMVLVPGDFIEIGVWRGGTAALLAGAAPRKTMHLFDTFRGVAKANRAYDTLYVGGEHADTNQATVNDLFQAMGLTGNVHAGVFPEDTSRFLPASISLAHIDVDTYSSAKDSFLAVWPAVHANGVVIFDDYGFFGCEGVAQAVNEIISTTDDALFVHNINGHALLIKKR
jgi:O-methyltransferase